MKYVIEFDDTPGYGVDGDKYYKIKNKEWLWVREKDLNDFEMLVSCKDCKHYKVLNEDEYLYTCNKWMVSHPTRPNGYCNYGEIIDDE